MGEISPWLILQSVLPVYALILLGGLFRTVGILQKEADSSMMKLVINCLYPCLILDKIIASESVKNTELVAWTLPVGFFVIALGILVARYVGGVFRIPKGKVLNTFSATTGIQNYGFAAVPIVMALFPEDLLGVLFVHSLGVEVALWTIGIACIQGQFPKNLKALLSPPILAVVVGLGLTFTGLSQNLKTSSGPLLTLMAWLGACSFPIALLLVGATLSDEIKKCIPTLKVALTSSFVRLGALPLIILSLIYLLPCPKELKLVMVVQAAMPSAVMPIVLSKLYGGDPATAGQVVIVTQTFGIITIPIWISLGLTYCS